MVGGMKWESTSDTYWMGLTIGMAMGSTFWILFDDSLFGLIMGICFAIIFSQAAGKKHFAEVDGRVLRFRRKGAEQQELSLDDVSGVTYANGTMTVTRGGHTQELDSAGDDAGLEKFVWELQPLLG